MQCPLLRAPRAQSAPAAARRQGARRSRPRPAAGLAARRNTRHMIAGHAALLALKSGRPVKLVYDRVEDMVATTKRHPSIIRHRTGVTRDGRLDGDGDRRRARRRRLLHAEPGGAVARRASTRRALPLRHVRIRGRAMAPTRRRTARSADSARRRPSSRSKCTWSGSPKQLGLDPVRLREINALEPGDTTATGQTLRDDAAR